ncbi:MAG: hypothetical protein ACT4OF_00225 [Caulobacteraceae bacterium]
MHSLARWTIILVILALSASVALPARAAFGDCATREYWASFDERYADPRAISFDCIERLRVPVGTTSGARHIRIVHDHSADWIADEAAMREFDRAVRASAEAIGLLGGVELEDVTVFLADDFPPGEGAERFSDIAALTEFSNDGECRIIVYLAGPASVSDYAASVVAHEIFHCVQVANLRPEQMGSGSVGRGGGADWWLEGSATWFAALAVPDPALIRSTVADFDASSATTPLNRMAYEAAVFFLWLGEESPAGVMDFLRRMATSRDESAQRAVMSATLTQERWLDFAEAYLDREIRHPHGTDLGLSPTDGEVWEWSATRTQSLPLEPFVLTRGVVAFQCGHWRTSVRPGSAHRARPEEGGAWSTLPEEIDTSSGSGGSYRFTAINTTTARVTMNIVGTMESGCGDCAGVSTIDACVIGSWRLTSGGAAEWMRAMGAPANISTANETITFRADGTYVTGVFQGEMEGPTPSGGHVDGNVQAQAGGRWSTSGGVLNLCADMQALGGNARVTTRRGRTGNIPVAPAPPINSSERYSCADASLNTERDIPGAPPMPSQYTRTGGG